MAKNKNNPQLTKRQASIINRGNRKISGNLNSLIDELNTMAYGIPRTDKADNLVDEFNSILNSEINDVKSSSNGDMTSFITKLFSENNKRLAANIKDIESIFNSNDGQLEAFINEQYRNRLIKFADLNEVASQLVELKEAINITRDAIISPDIITGHMSRNITFDDDNLSEHQDDYIPIVEKIEESFGIQEKIKNFIIPNSLKFGEYYIYCIPYAKIFEKFSKEKNSTNGKFMAYAESVDTKSLYDNLSKLDKERLKKVATEYVMEKDFSSHDINTNIDIKKEVPKELEKFLSNVSVCNEHVPLCILEEGVDSYREYYTEFVEDTITEKDDPISFNAVMSGIDNGLHLIGNSSKISKNKKSENFSNISDCYIKMIDPMHLLPIQIMDEIIGYYYIQEEDITPLSGILTSTVYYDKFDQNRNQNSLLSTIADTIVSAFDKKFLDTNIKFKRLIVEALNYFKLNNRRIKFQFIPKEYIIPFKINKDEHGNGVSILEDSLFYAKLYLMLLLFKIMTIVLNSNDTKINYIKQSGIEKNVVNKIQEIARKKQERQITMQDMFSYTTLINKIGQGSEMYIPVGKSNERGIETEILSGQEVQLNTELMESLKKAYISGTGVPDVLMNYINEADFAKTLELANNRFQGRVVSFQLDYNRQITELYRAILRYSSTIPSEVIESLEFNFVQPKYHNANITNDLLNNYNSLQDFLVNLYFGQDNLDDPEISPKVKSFKKKLAKERLPMIDFNQIDEIFNESLIDGTKEFLNPTTPTDQE